MNVSELIKILKTFNGDENIVISPVQGDGGEYVDKIADVFKSVHQNCDVYICYDIPEGYSQECKRYRV